MHEKNIEATFQQQLTLINALWQNFQAHYPLYLKQYNFPLDHFAIIDFPHKYGGIEYLSKEFKKIGFEYGGEGYLPDKINDFAFYRSKYCYDSSAFDSFPQAVLADFRLNLLSSHNRKIIDKYLNQTAYIEDLPLHKRLEQRSWPLPTKQDYLSVWQENQLMAWVLLFGRSVNHFGVAVNFNKEFSSLSDFINQIDDELNQEGGLLKGNSTAKLEQASLMGKLTSIKLEGGEINARLPFVEFVWRFQLTSQPLKWQDYYTDFIGHHANNIIESLN